ncbi:MAG: tRNA pseudouridine(38-40) synthase TruA [Bdellovibrionaceae bacterium]|nr:tRNA pseudouridine(38-40) synthase TruA [Pseudobdellovibrionaceae bacterium]
MARYRMLISYDGTDFCGWQRQGEHKNSPKLPSIQETLEKAVGQILNHPLDISASGRTDAGVHAVGQVIHFETERKIPQDLCWALRSKLPPSISPKALWLAPDEFHATLSAVNKTYRYWIYNQPRASALFHRYSWWIRTPLDLSRMNRSAEQLLGTQDFASFRNVGTPTKTTIRRIDRAVWTETKPGILKFEVTGSGFMKQMVRNLVGTMTELEIRGKNPEKMSEIIALKDRSEAGPAAPAQGLFLMKVRYPKALDNKCRQL